MHYIGARFVLCTQQFICVQPLHDAVLYKFKLAKMSTRKATTKSKQRQKFLKKYSDEWPCLMFSKQSDYFGFCTLCNVDFCVSHAGRNDCQKHIATDKHSRAAEHVRHRK